MEINPLLNYSLENIWSIQLKEKKKKDIPVFSSCVTHNSPFLVDNTPN